MELFDKMLQREKEDFRRISNRLLSACFLCRANETSKSDYYFVLKYKNEFNEEKKAKVNARKQEQENLTKAYNQTVSNLARATDIMGQIR